MQWFWITLLILTTGLLSGAVTRRLYAWTLVQQGHQYIDGACVQCLKKMPSILYNNTQCGGFMFCSDACVMKAHEDQRKGFEKLNVVYDEERVIAKAERESANQIIMLQAAIIASHAEVEASLNLQLSEKSAELRALEEIFNSLSHGASA